MFGRKKTIVVEEEKDSLKIEVANANKVKPTLAVPIAREVGKITLTETELTDYCNTAQAVGFEPAALLEVKLKRFLQENGIKVYNYEEIANYMTTKAKEKNMGWYWRPLRQQDIVTLWMIPGEQEGWIHYGYYISKDWNCRPYDKAVPISILRQVKKIVAEFGDKIQFFVSDYAVPRPDPFIMIKALDVPALVFGFWDEPDFKG